MDQHFHWINWVKHPRRFNRLWLLILAMCLRPFIRIIISSGLGVAKRQKDFAKTQVFPRTSNKWTQDQKKQHQPSDTCSRPYRDKGAWKGWGSYRRSCVAVPVNDRDCPRISLWRRRQIQEACCSEDGTAIVLPTRIATVLHVS